MSNNTNSPTTGNKETTTSREVSITLPTTDQSPQTSPGSSSSPSPKPSGGSPARRIPTGLSGKHSVFRGIRLRNGKWVSEIREPRKTTRIWLGTYPVLEMAAAAYDVAALALKGSDTVLNFPGLALTYVPPVSNSAVDIRAAASKAAEMKQPADPGGDEKVLLDPGQPGKEEEDQEEGLGSLEFMDEEEMLNMPTLLTEMAEGMLMSPPRMMMITSTVEDDSPENHEGDNLWSYK